MRGQLRQILRDVALGSMPLSALDRALHDIKLPLLSERREQRAKEWIVDTLVHPLLRDWGVVLGGRRSKESKSCVVSLPETVKDSVYDLLAAAGHAVEYGTTPA